MTLLTVLVGVASTATGIGFLFPAITTALIVGLLQAAPGRRGLVGACFLVVGGAIGTQSTAHALGNETIFVAPMWGNLTSVALVIAGLVSLARTHELSTRDAASAERLAEEQRRHHDQLTALAATDDLTGLLNTRGLHQLSHDMIGNLSREGGLAAIYMDLNGFKPINDTYGHDAGDTVLRGVGQRLKRLVRNEDLVARVGGDEFVIISRCPDYRTARNLADELAECLTQPFAGSADLIVSGSFGVAFEAAPRTIEELISAADAEMFNEKRTSKIRDSQPDRSEQIRGPRIEADGPPAIINIA